ncbi:MAG: leucyl aminopeptidase family protein [Oceanobacter sp.]
MPHALTYGAATDTTRSLTLIQTDHYDDWLNQQTDNLKNWLASSNYKGSGLALLPAADGTIDGAVFGSSDLGDAFIAGDLSNQLPSGEYMLTNEDSELATRVAFSWAAGSYRFDRYKKSESTPARLRIQDEATFVRATHLAEATALVRDLINTPTNDMLPEHLSTRTQELASRFGADFNEIVGEDLLTENYPMVYNVGRASASAPRLLDLRWGKDTDPKLTLVGKGVCFDTGGLNIKTGNFMRQMKKDMGGSAHVLGLAHLIMATGLPVNLRVLIPAVENAVAGNAFRPGDILPTRKGLTVEIDNTDAEGRLVLCDALAEAASENPELIIDFATLTGACRVALGTELPGFFCNDKTVTRGLEDAGDSAGEPVWNLPLHKPYFDFMKSDIADLVNGASSPYGGAITAALYLEAFVDEVPWVHYDIMAWNLRKLPGRPVGGEAMGMRATFEYLEQRFGK